MFREMWVASILLILLGFLGLAASAFLARRAGRSRPYRGFAEARVVEIIPVPRTGEDTRSEFRNRICAVFEFYAGGKPVKLTDTSGIYPCPYRMGESVQISYDPGDPQRFCIIRRNKWEYLAKPLYLLGILLVIGGGVLFFLYAGRVTL